MAEDSAKTKKMGLRFSETMAGYFREGEAGFEFRVASYKIKTKEFSTRNLKDSGGRDGQEMEVHGLRLYP